MPARFRYAHASAPSWQDATLEVARKVGLFETGTWLGFVYATDAFADDLGSIVGMLRDNTNVRDWVGTVGIGVLATGREYFDEPAIAIMVAPFEAEDVCVVPRLERSISELGTDERAWIAERRPLLGLVHADPRTPEIAEMIGDLAEETGAFLVGGLASSRGAMPQAAGDIGEGGLSGVLFAGGTTVATNLSQGCSPIGPVHTVTRAADNVVIEIDRRPALEVLLSEVGAGSGEGLRRALAATHVGLPVPGSDTGDYLVRNLVSLDPDAGSIGIAALVDPGDRLMFCRRDPTSAEQDLRRMLGELRGRLPGPPRGGIYVSCLARGPNMFGPGSREIAILREELGEFPLVGFFANGELSSNRLYGYTGVLTLFA